MDTGAKEKVEGYFAEIGYDQEQYETDMQNVAQTEENHGPFFNATMTLRLEGNQMVVEVPYNDITYEADYPLTYVSVLPMFGAAGTDQEGFIFIPEGSDTDATRNPEWYDKTYRYLQNVGVKEL
jgi:hypothetical protein